MKKVLVVEYPGIVVDADKAIQSMGGIHQLAKSILEDEDNPQISVSFRPNSKTAHPLQSSTNLHPRMVIVKRKVRRRKSDNSIVSQEIVSANHAWRLVTFRELCDFQYGIDTNLDSCKFIDSIYQWKKDDIDRNRSALLQKPSPLLPPPVFARVQIPFNYRYKHFTAAFEALNPHRVSVNDEMGENGISKRANIREEWEILFSEDIPTAMTALIDSKNSVIFDCIRELMEHRPIWLLPSLIKVLGEEMVDIREESILKILPHLAYKFVDGPWKNCWIRRDYDPRLDKTSHVYQVLYTRRKRNDEDSIRKAGLVIDGKGYHQICDINNRPLRKVAEYSQFLRSTCSEYTGWLPPSHVNAVKEALKFIINRQSSLLTREGWENQFIEMIKPDDEMLLENIAAKGKSKNRLRAISAEVERQLNQMRMNEMPDDQWIASTLPANSQSNDQLDMDDYELFGMGDEEDEDEEEEEEDN